jgi:hypothetical protein
MSDLITNLPPWAWLIFVMGTMAILALAIVIGGSIRFRREGKKVEISLSINGIHNTGAS